MSRNEIHRLIFDVLDNNFKFKESIPLKEYSQIKYDLSDTITNKLIDAGLEIVDKAELNMIQYVDKITIQQIQESIFESVSENIKDFYNKSYCQIAVIITKKLLKDGLLRNLPPYYKAETKETDLLEKVIFYGTSNSKDSIRDDLNKLTDKYNKLVDYMILEKNLKSL